MTEPATERRETPSVYQGVDLQAEARHYCRALGITLPKINFRHSNKLGCTGRAWSYLTWAQGRAQLSRYQQKLSGRIVLTIGCTEVSRVLVVLLHELVHVAAPRQHHNEAFRALLVRTARKLWGVKVEGWLSVPAGDYNKRAYAIDDIISTELQVLLDSLAVVPAAVKIREPEAPVSLQEQRERLVQKRAEHARKMLAKNEKKLSAAQKNVSKWRTKVRYYDKRAAAKASP